MAKVKQLAGIIPALVADILAAPEDIAGVVVTHSRQGAQQGRLAAAVGAQYLNHLPHCKLRIEARKEDALITFTAQVTQFNQRRGCRQNKTPVDNRIVIRSFFSGLLAILNPDLSGVCAGLRWLSA